MRQVGSVLVSINPERALAFVLDMFGNCIVVPPGTSTEYLGRDADYIRGAMYSTMRFEDGTEPQPNDGHSANGYPYIIEIPGPF